MRVVLLTSVVALAVMTAAVPHNARRGNGFAVPIAKHSWMLNPDMSVNIDALNAELASTKAKIAHSLDIYERNMGVPHPGASKRTQPEKRNTGIVDLSVFNHQVWYANISVGTPPTDFAVEFNAGLGDIFLPGPNCTSYCDGHKVYDPQVSRTAQDLNRTFFLSHGQFTRIYGDVYSDTVTVGGLTAVKQAVGAATNYSSNLAQSAFAPDGMLGLGFQSLSVFNSSPVFETLLRQGEVDEPAFSLKLAQNGSELYLGGANPELYLGDFTKVPVTREAWWEVNMDSIESNGQTVKANISSIIDTGTALVVVPPSDAVAFYKAVGGSDASSTVGAGYYTFPCDAFPIIHFTFGGTPFLYSPNTMNIGQVSANSTDCISGIVGQDLGFTSWVVGGTFVENVYAKFVFGDSQSQSYVGLAELA